MFTVNTHGCVQVLSGSLPISAENLAVLRPLVDQCFSKGQPQIVVHLAAVPLIDGSGLEFLLDMRDRALRSGGLVHLAEPKALCRDILQVTGLAEEFALFDQLSAAIGSFAL